MVFCWLKENILWRDGDCSLIKYVRNLFTQIMVENKKKVFQIMRAREHGTWGVKFGKYFE